MYSAYVTRINNVREHPNANKLKIGDCFGNSIVIGIDTPENQLGIYFPTDGKLGEEYATANNLLRLKDEAGNEIGGFLDPKKRNIKAIRLRGEMSDGLFMPLESLSKFVDITTLKEGDTITVLNGIVICEKYIPVKQYSSGNGSSNKNKQRKIKYVTYPLFLEHVDTSQLAYNKHVFKPGDLIEISLKYHGTSARTSYNIKQDITPNILQKIFRIKPKPKIKWDHITGTRRTVLNNIDRADYAKDKYRITHHNYFKDKLNKGETVYYEIVGYGDGDVPIMKTCNNAKIKDKEFSKMYGDTTVFTYGMFPGQNHVYVYRMTLTNEDGFVVEYSSELITKRCQEMAVDRAQIFDRFIFTDIEDMMRRVEEYYDGPDPTCSKHIREGIVVRICNRNNFAVYKHKNDMFKILEGIIKDESDEPDVEEMEEIGSSDSEIEI